ncbi:MAG: peptidase T [Bacilli bacterium]|nr:peptidase T [Bacilli bacterium]
MMLVHERFLNYVKIDTQSDPHTDQYPSTSGQLELARLLKQELESMGVKTTIDNFGYVIGKIPSNLKHKVPTIALIAHMDTSPDASGKNIKPRIIYNYDGSDIILNTDRNIVMTKEKFPTLNGNVKQDLIVTDGTTLLGADDKAGVAEIMALVEDLQKDPKIEHGELVVVFTPDEEVGNGTLYLDIDKINADFAYTLDGSQVGEIAFENFNAARAVVTINGKSVHPGSAKNKMVNAISVANEFDNLLPKYMRPEITEKYEGFNHLHEINGNVEKTVMEYIIRNHDLALFAQQKEDFLAACQYLNEKYGEKTCYLEITDSYFNMREKLDSKKEIIDIAIDAIRESELEPIIEPIRGGTDGARLTYMGLPCPNLGTGGYNFHGPYEYASIQEMELAVRIIKKIVTKVTQLK